MTSLHVALSIAGTDPTGGAGIMADLKSFQARSVYGMAVVTSVVAQNTKGVQLIRHLDQEILEEQLKSVSQDIVPDAIKTGMLAQVETIELVASYLAEQKCPYVLDPVMVATSGDRLIEEDAIQALKTKLLPLATIITPNLPEAEVLVGRTLKSENDIMNAGRWIRKELGVKNVVIKGGHLANVASDYLFLEDGEVRIISAARIATNHTHGTGCTYAAVITAELAKGRTVAQAVETAKRFITEAIQTAPELGHGNGPVNHTTYRGE
ncbi:TPA: bifunctional hydroxymethylpyrimidine kinase/phosphomethylpyrimidine kinase [Streptococcus suis]|uniref:bifunctional hydroxymethylpyrimidine kinase/phosphomethylpyrimidine kinase n=1 Tax=Streptococcus parasuis TaxID=1501662 RepID=UPI001C1F52ED|nr:bifunctional hydroxymethylpyrimidine kinase/phosphomethylpyrimidine kinase [Streptococcus parasuis]MDG4523880.1 bifunctional hydroxymethylpyrimidine kinase/phosphomethylpyrimidine kinase [Streptococcus suis]QWV86892.1 bifunctional hydroxymethylpyrimidine kinase/phosphomethylpyrimidine kinase [Streptococcus parasuis]ULL20926.1 bifunctional hydroxymethylpyrimidine kinase/phosphomethylpyrimidine kinase [Streptococcus suis]